MGGWRSHKTPHGSVVGSRASRLRSYSLLNPWFWVELGAYDVLCRSITYLRYTTRSLSTHSECGGTIKSEGALAQHALAMI